jgi:hypothetical protein
MISLKDFKGKALAPFPFRELVRASGKYEETSMSQPHAAS